MKYYKIILTYINGASLILYAFDSKRGDEKKIYRWFYSNVLRFFGGQKRIYDYSSNVVDSIYHNTKKEIEAEFKILIPEINSIKIIPVSKQDCRDALNIRID